MKTTFTILLILSTYLLGLGQNKVSDTDIRNFKEYVNEQIVSGFSLVKTADIKSVCRTNYISLVKKYNNGELYIIHSNTNINKSDFPSTKFYEIDNQWKLSPSLKKIEPNIPQNKEIILSVHLVDLNLFKNSWFLKYPSSKIIDEYHNDLVLKIKSIDFNQLVNNRFVSHLNLYNKPKVESTVTEGDLTVNFINRVQQLNPGLNGNGLTVSIKELLFNEEDIDFKNRLFFNGLEATELDEHADLIGTTIGGAGNSSRKGKGVATAVTLTSSSFLRVLPDDEQIITSSNISVQNHSYGTRLESEYGIEAAAYDLHTNTLPKLVHVFSSGNSGILTSNEGIYRGLTMFSNQTGNFKNAKNILTVGAINRNNEVDARSSRGPAYDGRIKPEIVAYAPGGTSDAAALVSGVSILLQQVFRDEFGELPSSSLIKAAFIAGAEDVGPVGIDFQAGYGKLNALKSTTTLQNKQFFEDSVSQGKSKAFEVTIPEGTNFFKIAITWNDLPANPGEELALVNDLDLKVTDPNAEVFLPWVLNSFPSIDSLNQKAKRKQDHLNNAEVVTIKTPEAGTYTIDISGFQIEGSHQSFSVAYLIEESDQFEWTFPTEVDPLVADNNNVIRWQSTLNENLGTLEYNLNESGWIVLRENINLENGFFNWPIDLISGTAQLRFSVGNRQYVSDTFAISEELAPNVLFNCEEEFLINWNRVPNASGYAIHSLGEQFLQLDQIISDTSLLISKSEISQNFFSVQPIFGDLMGVSGRAIDFEAQGTSCYYLNFVAFQVGGNEVEALLALSTDFNISHVILQKTVNGERIDIQTIAPPFNELTVIFNDPEIESGESVYNAAIVLNDGTQILTQNSNVTVPDENSLTLFPNPVDQGNSLIVISRGNNYQYHITDFSGRVMIKDQIEAVNDFVPINLSPGIYVFSIIKNGKSIASKRFVVK